MSKVDFAMNHRPSGSMPLSKAAVGFIYHKFAEGLTERSVNSYERLLNKWIEYEGDKDIAQVALWFYSSQYSADSQEKIQFLN